MKVNNKTIILWLENCHKSFVKNQELLTALDMEIGDSDHGINMLRGFERVSIHLPKIERQNIGTILKNTGVILHSSVGGISGSLYGTFFIQASNIAGFKSELDLFEFIACLQHGIDCVVDRFGAKLGDKTMCDVWIPVLNEASNNITNNIAPNKVLDAMLYTAEKSATLTINMQAKKWRASSLGERSIGHQDPGATSSLFIIEALTTSLL